MCTMLYVAVEPAALARACSLIERSFRVRPVDEATLRTVFGPDRGILQLDGGYCACGLLFRERAAGAGRPRGEQHARPAVDARQHAPVPTAETLRSAFVDLVRVRRRSSPTRRRNRPRCVTPCGRRSPDVERGAVGLEDGRLLTVVRDPWRLEL